VRKIFPQPGHTEGELTALLATRQFVYVDCFTIFPKIGDPLRYSSAQRTVSLFPIDDDSNLAYFTSDKVKVSGLQMKAGIGVEVDEQTLHMDFPPDFRYYGMSMPNAIKVGRLDGSTIRRDRYFAVNWGSPNEPVDWIAGITMFMGRFSTVDKVSRSMAEFKVKSNLILLNVKMPHNLYQTQCNNTFGDPVCGIDRGALQINTTIGVGSDALTIYTSDAAANHKYGTCYFEDVYSVTQTRTIKSVEVGVKIVLVSPLDFTPEVGENFLMQPGCSRTWDGDEPSCETWNNQPQYKGYPFVPPPESAF
jgi:hypothetical protein